ncbi:focal adhesion kinase 1-like isoform X3 [Xyrauchen texanus]|uniref:focal adhesion kinase 1-like isoform X3 n=1 Tax=Xyrauchen texanus TaxID=154827 RepID=UPI00224299E5|nr:focal adhesion kinase 1-like isoform X3 [Xyrauchen texanus]
MGSVRDNRVSRNSPSHSQAACILSPLKRTHSRLSHLLCPIRIKEQTFSNCSTILAEEKTQQEERSRMEMRRHVPVSWDSGGSDEAPPKPSRRRPLQHSFSMDCLSASAAPRPPQQPFGSQISLCILQPEMSASSLGSCNKTIINQSPHMQSQLTLQQNTHTQTPANAQQLNIYPQTQHFPQTQPQLLLQPLPLHCSLLLPQGPWRSPYIPPSTTKPAFFNPHYPTMQQLRLTHVHCRPSQPSRPGYPSPRSSEGFYPSPQHMGQHNHYQMAGHSGPHSLLSVPGSMYPQAAGTGLDPHDSWNHRRGAQDHMWNPSMEDGVALRCGLSQLMEEQLLLQQQQMDDDQRWLEQEERLLKPDGRSSRGSIDRDDGSLQGPTGNQHIYQPIGKAEHAAPPKKPPRPGAPGHPAGVSGLNPTDRYNEGVKIQPQEINPPPTANLDRSNDKVYENVTGLVKAVIEMSSKIQPAPPEEYVPMVKEVGLALRTLLATVDETIHILPAHTHREIEMAQKLLNSDLAELINKMKLAQQYVMTSLQQDYKKQMLTAAHALAVDAKNLLDVIDQARLKMLGQARPH